MRVLIVDDSVVMRMIVERGLRAAGMSGAEFRHASNGLEALAEVERAEARGSGFDLILTDVHMPVMDGPELLAELRKRELARGVPVVLVTADDGNGAPREDSRVKGEGFSRLTKPFTLEQMQASIGSVLAHAAHG